MSYGQILYTLQRAIASDCLHTVVEDNQITGMIIAYLKPTNELEIEQLICSSPKAFKILREGCRKIYKDIDLTYSRKGCRRKLKSHLI